MPLEQYIYGEIEVEMTGRIAKKAINVNNRRATNTSISIVHEIQPIDKENGSWKKWVKLEELYKIEQYNFITHDDCSTNTKEDK